nr:two-component sensor histidine kinase [Bradyrhizobium sp.]
MSDVIASMRRTLLSCTSLARNGGITLGAAVIGGTVTLASIAPAEASDLSIVERAISTFFGFNRQEIAVLATALALLGFSVMAAILLMRARIRAASNEARLRADVQGLQIEADRFRALLFAEPQILISWAAGDNRPQISGDISLLMSPDSPQYQPQ